MKIGKQGWGERKNKSQSVVCEKLVSLVSSFRQVSGSKANQPVCLAVQLQSSAGGALCWSLSEFQHHSFQSVKVHHE